MLRYLVSTKRIAPNSTFIFSAANKRYMSSPANSAISAGVKHTSSPYNSDDDSNIIKKQKTTPKKGSTHTSFPYVKKPIVWVDCEMTGLDIVNDTIIEICCIITDGDLNIIDLEGYESVIHVPKERLDRMDEWCVNTHTKSGLVDKVLRSDKTLSQVDDELYQYISQYVMKGKAVLGGNTVYMDKVFMIREMPKVVSHLSYRLIDVSSFMEFGRRHNDELMKLCPPKVKSHTARSDILESIEQLKWYREHYLKSYEESKSFIHSKRKLDKIILN